jgi:hypothetical protein
VRDRRMAASKPIEPAGGSSSEKQEFILNVDGSVLYDHKGVSRIGGGVSSSSIFAMPRSKSVEYVIHPSSMIPPFLSDPSRWGVISARNHYVLKFRHGRVSAIETRTAMI